MTDASALPGSPDAKRAAYGSASRCGLALITAAAAVLAALVAAAPEATALVLRNSDAELVMLLRFMAGVKALLAVIALGVAVWRLGHPASAALTMAYVLAPALMCAAPVVIWQMAHVATGAALFHGGFVVLLLALYADRGEVVEQARTTALRLRRA